MTMGWEISKELNIEEKRNQLAEFAEIFELKKLFLERTNVSKWAINARVQHEQGGTRNSMIDISVSVGI